MCYNIQTSIVSFTIITISGIIALKMRQPILGCLMLVYGLMQLSEVLIWRGIDTNNETLNRAGTILGKYTLPSHNIAIGIGVLIACWASRNNPIYWIPLTVGLLFYIGVMIIYFMRKDSNNGITKACKYPQDKDRCTKDSARLEWPYPHSWYALSMIISFILVLAYVKPLSRATVIVLFYVVTFVGTALLGKRQVLGSWWCWASAALAPLVLIATYFMSRNN
jgi:hypothetical protein